ncbi:XAP5 domain-containing protein [Colletotrichum truncatum]|uniref:XAP5 domain-containing protein n=1 Tax=Colletotrichum truncatum TaxID=5467 RepID=A0ACC3ZL61_COLTU|nr:XAP5 domain-containing protein [Colletotrichum truncatum]KAF6786979.1 XAP5 domain-containing protein [Colletotrichum truncatum]
MSDQAPSRFTPQNKTTSERLSSNTVGLVQLSDFRKRRAEVLEQQERERDAALSGTSTPDRSHSATPDPVSDSGSGTSKPKKKKKKIGGSKLSFGDDEEEEGDDDYVPKKKGKNAGGDEDNEDATEKKSKVIANSSVAFVPKVMSKAALRREAAEREALRREFLAIQEAVKATEIAVPFVFYDGSNIPGGTVRVKKGDYVWVFLDKSRKVGAELGVGEKANARREWARVGVDDLMLVRGSIIVPHHYEFYFFVINKSKGPDGEQLFKYSAEAPPKTEEPEVEEVDATPNGGLTTAAALKAKATATKTLPDINTLEGATDDPTLTKVVDRRWYERNKHIYPASMWQEFDPEKDYQKEVRKDAGGNTFFFSR